MKIIFLGLLIAVLVVYGHGDDSNEPADRSDMEWFIHTLKEIIKLGMNEQTKAINEENEVNEMKAKKIEKYRKEVVEGDQKLSVIRNELTDSNLSTEVRSAFQIFLDITTEAIRNGKQWNEKRIETLNKEISQSREAFEQRNILLAQYMNSTRHLINSYPQYA
ncbi:uncharacterized protein LOC117563615 isoform X1 [Drosophila albomicans]|uniref:Uncharacterized protein LOC117563615 isoform X1 n=1 Tax=Drosophila albomicans TaxID=7291 RepID=A0A6P8XEB2_DROAB|nr:uncharacterized protein LOC117563615 isoform X1 [Drosophila albomicans]